MNRRSPSLILSAFRVPRGERLFVVGTTGSGKTILMRYLLPLCAPYLLVHDGKGRIDWPGFHLHRALDPLFADRYPWLVYRPPHEAVHNPAAAEPFFEFAYKRGETCVYVDEVRTIAKGDTWPVWYHACVTRGRELGVTMVSGTQRPARVPMELLSETEAMIMFRLNLKRDRERVIDVMGETDRFTDGSLSGIELPKHYWWHGRIGEEPQGPFHLNLALPHVSQQEVA